MTVSATGLPKLVVVISTFATTLPDELEIRMGETLRMLEAFPDEWCTVERIGRGKKQRGAVPMFCLEEKAPLVPRKGVANWAARLSVSMAQ